MAGPLHKADKLRSVAKKPKALSRTGHFDAVRQSAEYRGKGDMAPKAYRVAAKFNKAAEDVLRRSEAEVRAEIAASMAFDRKGRP